MRLVTDVVEFCTRNVPSWNPISISGYHIREAGSTAAQELAFTLADGFAYVEAGIARGLDVDEFAPRLSFFFNAHIDFFEEIAKYRAARRIWARHMRERYGAKDERSLKLRFHTQTAGCSLTAQQIENNVARTAFEALAAVLGGTNSLHTNSMDEVLALPTEKAAQIALRTQQILAYETGVPSVVDPLAGSWFVEDLTNRMEQAAEDYFAAIAERGGMLDAVDEGFPQREIADAAFRYQSQLETGERVIVGVNVFEQSVDTLAAADARDRSRASRSRRRRASRALRERRDNTSVATRLDALQEVATRHRQPDAGDHRLRARSCHRRRDRRGVAHGLRHATARRPSFDPFLNPSIRGRRRVGSSDIVGAKHILVVEDEEVIRETLRFNLVREGYQVSQAAQRHRGAREGPRAASRPDRARPHAPRARRPRGVSHPAAGDDDAGAGAERTRQRARQDRRPPRRRRRLHDQAVLARRAHRPSDGAAPPRAASRRGTRCRRGRGVR